MGKAIVMFQHEKGLKTDGVIGPATHKALIRWFLPYEAKLYNAAVGPLSGRDLAKQRWTAAAAFLYARRVEIHYTQSSLRMYGLRNHLVPPSLDRYDDCSGTYKYLCWLSGLVSPDHLGYVPWGFTGTMIEAGIGVTTAQIDVMDAIFFGSHWVPSHVIGAIGDEHRKYIGKCFSHGSEIGPLIVPRTYRSDLNQYHPVRRYATDPSRMRALKAHELASAG